MESIFGGYVFLNFLELKSEFLLFLRFGRIVGIFVGIIINTPAWIVFLERGFTRVILRTSQNGEFKELLISRDLMEIELNGVHFRRLCFFNFLKLKSDFFTFPQIPPYFWDFFWYHHKYPCLDCFFGTRVYQGDFDDIQEW